MHLPGSCGALAGRAGHPARIARTANEEKIPILRHRASRRGAKKYLRAVSGANGRLLDGLQSLLDCLGRAFNDEKIGPCRPLRLARTLFPMAQCVDAEPEPARELFLRHVQARPDRLYVDLRGHMDAIGALVRLPLGIGHRFPKATSDTVGNLAHGFFLLNLPTSNAVSCRKSLRSCWPKSARSFLA